MLDERVTNERGIQGKKNVEYFAGGNYLSAATLHVLSNDSDPVTRKLEYIGKSLEDMLRDPEIKKCRSVIKASVLEDGIGFYSPINRPPKVPNKKVDETEEEKAYRVALKKQNARYDKAKEYTDFLNRSLENLDSPILDTVEDLLDALFFGNRIAEKVWDTVYDPILKRDVDVITGLRVKSRDSVEIVVDKYRKIYGVRGYGYLNGKFQPITIQKDKFIIFSWDKREGDPRGTSMLEAVFNAWYLKTQLLPEYLKWIQQCAIPGLIGMMPPNTEGRQQLINSDGSPAVDAQNNPVYRDDAVGMLEQLKKMRSASVMVIPNGASVTPLNSTVSGDPFKGMLDALNKEMEMGLLNQTLATSDSRHNTRAASETHISVMDNFIAFVKQKVINMLTTEYVKPMMKNFKGYDSELEPKVRLTDGERRKWAEDCKAVEGLFKANYLTPAMLPETDKILGLEGRILEGEIPTQINATTE